MDEVSRLYDARERAEWTVYERLAERRALARALERYGDPLDPATLARHGMVSVAQLKRLHEVHGRYLDALEALVRADGALDAARRPS